MNALLKFLAAIAGLAVLAASTHWNVMHAGGYKSDGAPLIIAFAAFIGIGMAFVAVVWNSGSRAYASLLFIFILSGEAYWLLVNADREVAARDQAAEPMMRAHAARTAAIERVKRAEADKTAADQAAASEAAKDGCRKNCAELLRSAQREAAAELSGARLALANAPEPLSGTALADRIGMAPWVWDLILAVLRSVGVLAGSLAFGLTLHKPRSEVIREPTKNPKKTADVAQYALECLQNAPGDSVESKRAFPSYCRWAAERDSAALPKPAFEAAFEKLCKEVGLQVQPSRGGLKVLGVKLAA